ncbi:MAG: pyrimidine/purine nucleoside phosphorylase [Arenicella sp.]
MTPTIENVTITKAANVYFGGKVTSRKIELIDGSIKTLGIMMPGDYEFGTEAAEVMEILAGELKVKLPNSQEWIDIEGGQSFNVPANSTFQLEIKTLTDYCCSYES